MLLSPETKLKAAIPVPTEVVYDFAALALRQAHANLRKHRWDESIYGFDRDKTDAKHSFYGLPDSYFAAAFDLGARTTHLFQDLGGLIVHIAVTHNTRIYERPTVQGTIRDIRVPFDISPHTLAVAPNIPWEIAQEAEMDKFYASRVNTIARNVANSYGPKRSFLGLRARV